MATKTQWQPLDLKTLPEVEILACDPSLTALGLVYIRTGAEPVIYEAEKLSTAPTQDRKGWEDTFFRAELMEALIDALLDSWEFRGDDIIAVHEAPPAGGGSLVRTESSILTGYAFRQVARENGFNIDRTVTPQSHKKLITGNHLASKKQLADAIKDLLPQIKGGDKITNEATRDALSIALYASARIG